MHCHESRVASLACSATPERVDHHYSLAVLRPTMNKRARSDTAQRTLLTFRAGSKSMQLSLAGLERHPGSLLHRLASTDSDGQQQQLTQPISLEVSDASNCPISSWKHGLDVTAAFYRDSHLPMELLSDLLRTHTAADLLNNLQRLAGFLKLPGPISSYLPPPDLIPLGHLGVVDLHYEAAANAVVKCIMSHSVTSNSITGDVREGAAHFFIRDLSKGLHIDSDTDSDSDTESESDSESGLGINACALVPRAAGNQGSSRVSQVAAAVYVLNDVSAEQLGNRNSSNRCVFLGKHATGSLLSAEPQPCAAPAPAPIPLQTLFQWRGVTDSRSDSVLARRMSAALNDAVSRVSANGRTEVMKVSCVQGCAGRNDWPRLGRSRSERDRPAAADPRGPVWVVQWQIG